jgi:hypothetical protein
MKSRKSLMFAALYGVAGVKSSLCSIFIFYFLKIVKIVKQPPEVRKVRKVLYKTCSEASDNPLTDNARLLPVRRLNDDDIGHHCAR